MNNLYEYLLGECPQSTQDGNGTQTIDSIDFLVRNTFATAELLGVPRAKGEVTVESIGPLPVEVRSTHRSSMQNEGSAQAEKEMVVRFNNRAMSCAIRGDLQNTNSPEIALSRLWGLVGHGLRRFVSLRDDIPSRELLPPKWLREKWEVTFSALCRLYEASQIDEKQLRCEVDALLVYIKVENMALGTARRRETLNMGTVASIIRSTRRSNWRRFLHIR